MPIFVVGVVEFFLPEHLPDGFPGDLGSYMKLFFYVAFEYVAPIVVVDCC